MIKVIKKKNPTDKDLISKIEIYKVPKPPKYIIQEYQILLNNNIIGRAGIYINDEDREMNSYISYININEKYKRKGLATYLYKYIENDLDIELNPARHQSEEGKAFWKNRLGKND